MKTRRWFKIVLNCCVLVSAQMMATRCSAVPQEQGGSAAQAQVSKGSATSNTIPGSIPQSGAGASPSDDYNYALGPHLLKDFAEDQKRIWTSPSRLRLIDVDWLVPLGATAGFMFATDTEFSKHLSNSPSRFSESNNIANFGVASLAGASAGLYFWGDFVHDEHLRETGFLAAEAALDSLADTYALKYAFGRERPLTDAYRGDFWKGGDSFPSEHSDAAWSIASVIAHEYPGPLTSILAYGMASAVGASRITAKQHFPSDVLVGSALGWFVGEEVYRHHHNPENGGGDWETYAESHDEDGGSGAVFGAATLGSPYVELDSWIYPVIERLIGLGYIHSSYLDMRPWTRMECAHLVEEAGDNIRAEAVVPEGIEQLYETLESEFAVDLDAAGGGSGRSLRLESLYTTITGIDGPPLHDSYHLGQTIINNYGRPYEEGFNTYDGFSGYGTKGRFTLYVRGEFQHAPSALAYSLAVREAFAKADVNPLQPAFPFTTINQFTLLDTYVSANVSNWDFSFGKQSLWWGPGDDGALLFSDNAEPIYMFRASNTAPIDIPLASRLLGPIKFDLFFGKLSGNEFPPRPLIHGEKIGFKMTKNFELGFSRTSEFGGVGRPMTLGAIWNSYVSVKSSGNYQASTNPGKRLADIDFSYKVPFVRKWLTVYADSVSADDVLPLASPRRAAWVPGFYLARIPGLPKLDLRVEGGYTDIVTSRSNNGDFEYWDLFYHDLSTNKGNIIGSWMGREGKGVQAWSTYWFNSRDSVQFGYREAKVAKDFIPNGETVNDGSIKATWWVGDVDFSAYVQYEKWVAPLLAPGPQSNWTSSIQITFMPRSWGK